MFKSLIPKEEKYFEDFSSMIKCISEMVELSKNFYCGGGNSGEIFFKMKSLEKRCDEISQKVIKKLNKSFLTPFDREDIYALIKALEKLSDVINASVSRAIVYNLEEPIAVSGNLLNIAHMQIKELYISIVEHKVKDSNTLQVVRDLEQEADLIFRDAMTTLFRDEKNAIELFKQKEILEILEEITDKCQTVAMVIQAISLKNN